jgi:hypothetical protein
MVCYYPLFQASPAGKGKLLYSHKMKYFITTVLCEPTCMQQHESQIKKLETKEYIHSIVQLI